MDVVKKLIAVELVIIIVVLTAVVGEVFPPGRPRIRVDGEVYTLSGGEVYSIPDGSEKIGLLNGITHRTAERPAEDMWGTNLDAKYAGCHTSTTTRGTSCASCGKEDDSCGES